MVFSKLKDLIPKKRKTADIDELEDADAISDDLFGEALEDDDAFGDDFTVEDDFEKEPVPDVPKDDEVDSKLNGFESRLSKLELTIGNIQSDNDEVKRSIDSINQSMVELLSLYEVVSNQINPFVEGSEDGGVLPVEKINSLEERVNELTNNVELLKNEIESFTEKGYPENEDVEIALETLTDAFGTLSNDVDELNNRLDNILRSKTSLEKREKDDPSNPPEKIVTHISPVKYKEPEQPSIVVSSTESIEVSPPSLEGENVSNYPRLERIELTPANVVVMIKWLEFLMERVGRNNLVDVLDFYVEMGWISETVSAILLSHARGMDYYSEKPSWRLLSEDHTRSLLFIERLAGNRIDQAMIRRVERDISKLSHGIEEIYEI